MKPFLLALAFILFPALSAMAGPYRDSAHGNSVTGVDRAHLDARYDRYATGNCAHCHEQHGSLGGEEPYPKDGGASANLLFSAIASNTLCIGCHDGSTAADRISTQISKISSHAAGEARCIDCHAPHKAQKGNHAEAAGGNAVTGGPLLGIDGVEAIWSNPGTSPANSEILVSPILTPKSQIDREYELCLKCHSTYGGGPPVGLTDQGKEFNPFNMSHHPVAGTGQWQNDRLRTSFARTKLLKKPWSDHLDARMYCSDCHGSDSSMDPKGPHGSNKKYLLKAWGGRNSSGSYSNAAKAPDLLCLLCHVDAYGDGNGTDIGDNVGWTHKSNSNHLYMGEGALNNELGCYACHGGPAGYADFYDSTIQPTPRATSNGGRSGGIHGGNFTWKLPSGWNDNPARHFLYGGYNVGIALEEYNSGNLSGKQGRCWSYGHGSGGEPCGSMKGGKSW